MADAQARRALAQANLQRNQDLARQNFISTGALQARQQEVASAEAGWQAAQANAAAAGQEISRLQAERAALLAQRNNLRLIAPAAAVVASRDAEAGSTVVAGQSVLRLIDPSTLWVRLRVDQGRSAGLSPGLAASITSLIAIIRHHERSWILWLALLPGLFVVFLLVGEFLIAPFD